MKMDSLINTSFYSKLMEEVLSSVYNNYNDNYDYYRFGSGVVGKNSNTGSILKSVIKKEVNKRGYYNKSVIDEVILKIKNAVWINYFVLLYERLSDNESRELLIKVVTFRLLGHTKVKLPLSKESFWKEIEHIENNQDKEKFIDINFMNFRLYFTDLAFMNIPLKLYYSTVGVHIDFVIKKYELTRSKINIVARPGDVVIDGGGCFGDTALYFANKVDKHGSVHSFEFIPDNIKTWKLNIDLNPQYS